MKKFSILSCCVNFPHETWDFWNYISKLLMNICCWERRAGIDSFSTNKSSSIMRWRSWNGIWSLTVPIAFTITPTTKTCLVPTAVVVGWRPNSSVTVTIVLRLWDHRGSDRTSVKANTINWPSSFGGKNKEHRIDVVRFFICKWCSMCKWKIGYPSFRGFSLHQKAFLQWIWTTCQPFTREPN